MYKILLCFFSCAQLLMTITQSRIKIAVKIFGHLNFENTRLRFPCLLEDSVYKRLAHERLSTTARITAWSS